MFSKLLIANRGEIAVRVIRACKEMGIATVAVHSLADKNALHVSLADEAVCVGPSPVGESYLNMQAILSAAVATGAQAIHPGYGLLSENARFAELCAQCGIVFIGPPASVISRMGDKDEARRTMAAAGVPVVPGCDLVTELKAAKAEAGRIGYPLLVKARAGGGGRGIRLVNSPEEFEQAFRTASAEAQAAFGDGGCYLERFLAPVRHVEVQLLCDSHGNVLCLGERDCSVQRKNQKLIEECPSPVVGGELRQRMFDAARMAAKAVNYLGVGTVEFLLDAGRNFYFMEMNTRLQVEHPVTEMVTGVDLVKWQIRVANGYPLTMSQQEIALDGCAIECRINAEDPAHNHRPSCGEVTTLHVPGGPLVRFDTALYQGCIVPPFYDSMVGKLIVCAKTREEAIRKMRTALSELVLEGVAHNRSLHMDILADPDFAAGQYDTGFMGKKGL